LTTPSEYAKTAATWCGRANKTNMVRNCLARGPVPTATVIPFFTTGNVYNHCR